MEQGFFQVLSRAAFEDLLRRFSPLPAETLPLDQCLGRVMETVAKAGGTLLVTADHGNAEDMLDENGNAKTAHSLNPVPFVYVGPGNFRVRDGRLADVAPTILHIMNIPKPGQMTGESLLVPA